MPCRPGCWGFGSKKKDANTGKKLTPEQSALIDKAIGREKGVIKVVKERAPLVETYIQNMKPDPVMRQVPESDEHFLGRVEFGKVIERRGVQGRPEGRSEVVQAGLLQELRRVSGRASAGRCTCSSTRPALSQMLLMDSNGFDRQHYNFGFVRQ